MPYGHPDIHAVDLDRGEVHFEDGSVTDIQGWFDADGICSIRPIELPVTILAKFPGRHPAYAAVDVSGPKLAVIP